MAEEKKQLHIEIRDKVATLISQNFQLVGGNSDYEVVFDFDKDWDNHPAKTAVFVYGNGVPVHKVFAGNVCKGVEIRNATVCLIGVFAGDIMTTTPACVDNILRSINDEAGGVPEAPTQEVYNQIMELLQKAIQAHTELPVGGKAGQVLKKKSAEDYDTEWADDEKQDLSNYQTKIDNNLNTNSKEIVGAINEVKNIVDLKPSNEEVQEKIENYSYPKDEAVQKFDNYDYIMRQFGVITEEIKNEVANRILVPPRSDRFMYLNRIGGKSYSTENYLNPKYFSSGTDGFLTITHNGDGMITVNGTGEVISNYDFCFNLYNPPLKSFPLNGEEWYLSVDEPLPENMAIAAWAGNPDTGSEDGYWLYGDVTSVKIWGDPYLNIIQIMPPYDTEGGTITADNVTIKLTLSKGEPKKYTPFFEGLRDTKVTALRNNGANLIPFDYKGKTQTIGGVTFTPQEDGGVKVEGVAKSKWTYYELYKYLPFTQDITLSISGDIPFADIALLVTRFDADMNKLTDTATGSTGVNNGDLTLAKNPNVKYLWVRLWAKTQGATYSGTVYPMINYGNTAIPYKPYREPITTAIPKAIQDLPDYGKDGTYIDLENKQFINGETVTDISGKMGELNPLIPVEGCGSIDLVNERNDAVPYTATFNIINSN